MSELSVKDRIKGAKRERRTYKINLRGDLVAEIEQREDRLEKLQEENRNKIASGSARLGGPAADDTEAGRLAQEILDLRNEMAGDWLELVLEHQGFDKWRDFKLNHPPREEVEEDKVTNLNYDALVRDFMPGCVVEPSLDDEDWEGLFRSCNPGDLRDLGGVAYGLHERTLDVPLSRLAYATIARINADSGQQEPGASVNGDSPDGSQPSTTSSSTTKQDALSASP